MTRFVAEPALAPLKDFQRATADYVFRRLYRDQDAVRRFLIADEVGLGKTLVARGVIARTIEHLQDVVERVDIVYVCSNALIARQNLQRLRVEHRGHFELADRITMLPATAHRLTANRINLISFTPGTSFELKRGTGQAQERALLRLVLAQAWGQEWFRQRGSMRVFQGGVRSLDRFRAVYQEVARRYGASLDEGLVGRFASALETHDRQAAAAGEPGLWDRFDELCDTFGHARPVSGWSNKEREGRNRFIGDLRNVLARACLDALRPDLIILDEFQRFKHLLAEPGTAGFSPAAELAHELFDHVDQASGSQARVLLLSATPYKMLTTQAESGEDHHEDLVETVSFLLHHDVPVVDGLRRDLRALRRALQQVARDGGTAARAAREAVQATLRRVMVRTERLASTPDRSGMLETRPCQDLVLDEGEVARFVASARLARDLGVPDPLEYWKSAPYLLNFAERYRLREEFDAVAAADPGRVAPAVRTAGILDFARLRAFEPIPVEHARLRWLLADTVGVGSWKLLWIPPSLPYLEPSGPYADAQLQAFTKRLAFSSWTIVPTAITTLLTYEAERRMVSAGGPPRYRNTDERQNQARLLDFTMSKGRLTGMPVLGILYPSVVLARLGDPLALSRDRFGAPVPVEEAVAAVAEQVRARLDRLVSDIEASGGHVPRDGREDERWYWAAPMWLDWLADKAHVTDLFGDRRALRKAFTAGEAGEGGGRFFEHLDRAGKAALGRSYPELDAIPRDLPEVLARMALTAPGVVAARALARVTGRDVADRGIRMAACRVAWGLRTLFNGPEVTELVHHLHPGEPYWQRILDYSLAGNLQAVLDEYAHTLVSGGGHLDPSGEEVLDDIAGVMHDTVRLKDRELRRQSHRGQAPAGRRDPGPAPGQLRAATRPGA